jgi:deazaflavin-dependent oxidoreductase (nitroreductase family)
MAPRIGPEVAFRTMPEDPNPSGRNLFGQEHVRVYRETDGQEGYNWHGTTILLLTTTGRASGQQRTTPLIYRSDGDNSVVVASQGGAPDHPAWYKNLQAGRDATVQIKGERTPVRARTAQGPERERLWRLMAEVWPAYDEYQLRTEREIPVVVLEPR